MPPQDPSCLYAILYAPRDRVDALLCERIHPLVAAVRDHEDLDSFFFVRYSEPRWQLRVRFLGRSPWVNGPLRERVLGVVREMEASGEIEEHELTRYDRELDRYGGERGMSLAEQLFHLDSLACLEILDLDRGKKLARSRREYAMALVDAFMDLASFSAEERLEFYRFGFAWAVDQKTWGPEDMNALEERFQKIRGGLESLFYGAKLENPTRYYGGPEAAAVAGRFLRDARPVVERILQEHRAGRIRQSPHYLFWSYAHMMTNRLGVEANPEAILRYFMFRLLEERSRSTA